MFVCAIGDILPYNSFTKTVYHDNHQDFFSMRISLYQNMPKMIVTVMQTRSITSKQIAQFVVLLEHLTRNSGGRTPLPLPGFEFQSGQVYHSFSYIPFCAVKPTPPPPPPGTDSSTPAREKRLVEGEDRLNEEELTVITVRPPASDISTGR